MTRFDIVTIFPGFFSGPLDYGIVRRAREASLIESHVHDLRDFTHDRHKTVDDRPFGGGEGMVLKPEPLFEAVESLLGGPIDAREGRVPERTAIVLLSAAGKLFGQETAERFARLERILLICGRYEGVDERVAEHLATDEVSVGDFVLSGGELAAAMVMDATVRLIPGALGNEDSTVNESFSRISEPRSVSFGDARANAVSSDLPLVCPEAATIDRRDTRRCLLDFPHYTRPASLRGWDVPEILLSGNHQEIRRWRRQKALEKTMRNRPDLLAEEGN
ncbi:MAG TPA: tRNA (guanosine(37)-N1)-methyltransferase TrmD [Candidatus Acidoferrales bacterium]|nr:tRNA (guanosine(37)-N1)-methyltransferase TrmD [Candidatus Acidoferrales bacterium]